MNIFFFFVNIQPRIFVDLDSYGRGKALWAIRLRSAVARVGFLNSLGLDVLLEKKWSFENHPVVSAMHSLVSAMHNFVSAMHSFVSAMHSLL